MKIEKYILTTTLLLLIACSENENKSVNGSSGDDGKKEIDFGEIFDEGPTTLELEMASGYELGTSAHAVFVGFESIEITEDGQRLIFITDELDSLIVEPQYIWDPDLGGMTYGWEVDLDYFDGDLIDTDFLLTYVEGDYKNTLNFLAEATPEQLKDYEHGKVIFQSPAVRELRKRRAERIKRANE